MIDIKNFSKIFNKFEFLKKIDQRTITVQHQTNFNFITLNNINENVKKLEYAVRGPLVIRAGEIERELREQSRQPKLFNKVIRANIGDCHAVGQQPLTFLRQVLACCSDKSLLSNDYYSKDVKQRAQDLLQYCGGNSIGAYSDSAGVEIIRKHCAEYISKRDGVDSDWRNIVLTTGASDGIRSVLALINTGSNDVLPSGVMIPIPQYPLYSATIAEYGMYPVNYYLDEENEWSLNIDELERSLNEARKSCKPKAIVVINPGNPTGSVLTKENIKDIIDFAFKHRLIILADEVYQHNIYEGEFFSFKKIMNEMDKNIELASFMSASKGYMGECGLRGGYCELVNFDSDVRMMFLKMLSARLCSSVLGQIALDCIVKPPNPNEESFELYEKEKKTVLNDLKLRAQLVAETFNNIDSISSNKVAGAMYAFPKIEIPQKAVNMAIQLGQTPDFFYAMQLLEKTGICVVPGSGFGQKNNTYHFRTTILPPTDQLKFMMEILKKFHLEFLREFQ